MIKPEKWLYAILTDCRMPGATFQLAYWMTLKLKDNRLNLSDFERDKVGSRRTAQRSLQNLEWAGYVVVDRSSKKSNRWGQNTYQLTYPAPKSRRAAA
jgi:hypothetical protein